MSVLLTSSSSVAFTSRKGFTRGTKFANDKYIQGVALVKGQTVTVN